MGQRSHPSGGKRTMLLYSLLEHAAFHPDFTISCEPTTESWLRPMLTTLGMQERLRSLPSCPPGVVYVHRGEPVIGQPRLRFLSIDETSRTTPGT